MGKVKLIKRIKSLYKIEFSCVFLLPFAFCIQYLKKDQIVGLNVIIAMILNGFLLLEGSYFWLIIYKQLINNRTSNFINTYTRLKKINILLIIMSLTFVSLHSFTGNLDKMGTLIFLLLAILEQINYFEYQLMYDNKNDWAYLIKFRRLKKSKLNKVLIKNTLI